MAHLIPPTTRVRNSYLAGETEAAIEEGLSTDWLQEAAAAATSATTSCPAIDAAATPRRCWLRP